MSRHSVWALLPLLLALAGPAEAAFPGANARIAFTSSRDGGVEEVFHMRAHGSEQARLTPTPNRDFAPAYSPDGTRIAFVSRRDGNDEMYVMNADGSG